MKNFVWFFILTLGLITPSFAKSDKHKDHHEDDDKHEEKAEKHSKKDKEDKSKKDDEPWINVRITNDERSIIEEYLRKYWEDEGKKGKKIKSLPPGLAKKVARGGSLPPGWQKKVARGEVLPVGIYNEGLPLPDILRKRLPHHKGTETIVIDGKVVRLAQATREILDVFDLDPLLKK
jgi:hypothetical protein